MYVLTSDEFELKFPELSRADLGHLNFRAETELTLWHLGGFQLLYLIIPELKSHVIPYKFNSFLSGLPHWEELLKSVSDLKSANTADAHLGMSGVSRDQKFCDKFKNTHCQLDHPAKIE